MDLVNLFTWQKSDKCLDLDMLNKDYILSLIAEEKEQFSKYCQLCSIYSGTPDPLIKARHQGKVEILQILLKLF